MRTIDPLPTLCGAGSGQRKPTKLTLSPQVTCVGVATSRRNRRETVSLRCRGPQRRCVHLSAANAASELPRTASPCEASSSNPWHPPPFSRTSVRAHLRLKRLRRSASGQLHHNRPVGTHVQDCAAVDASPGRIDSHCGDVLGEDIKLILWSRDRSSPPIS